MRESVCVCGCFLRPIFFNQYTIPISWLTTYNVCCEQDHQIMGLDPIIAAYICGMFHPII